MFKRGAVCRKAKGLLPNYAVNSFHPPGQSSTVLACVAHSFFVCKESRKEVPKTKTNCNAAEVNTNTTLAGVAKIHVHIEADSIWDQHFTPRYHDSESFDRVLNCLTSDSANLQQLLIAIRTLGNFATKWLFQLDLKELKLVGDHRERKVHNSGTKLVPPQETSKSYFARVTKEQQRACPARYQYRSLEWVNAARMNEHCIGISKAAAARKLRRFEKVRKGIPMANHWMRDLSDWTVPRLQFVDVLYFAGEVIQH
ncbi:hypothetical protein BKA65DRAFT_546318 [Rhexocercosporidium sp. MPI-PUGE-AT-0058]|nr:hypothetical protein BKA65DRAFT_546318 [Rhexocercosporidium sp. MPI-PUGE-AT-0058]